MRFIWLIPIGIVVAFVTGGYFFATEQGVMRPFGKVEPLAMTVAANMRQHPERWHGDEFRITNGHVCVWVANEVYGFGMEAADWCWPHDGILSTAGKYEVLKAARDAVLPRLIAEHRAAVSAAAAK